ncbi:membrane-anchored junction protein isoform X1 [Centropristis striata]|uniref:membrane-anchored junction protein isoform X1 n=1 Tax=Centropristis striata TaxID=184440 RepID=UPI0027DFB27B|nr:membrane-anchored junction protein isoform X1 [Centropristis striata]XP_059211028.1 membrane-anchored junction protein isoform X1 [Centropristis striata]
MPLQAFSFPFPETRFFRAGSFIYKFKIRGSISFRGDQVRRLNCLSEELEEIIRTVLGNLDSLQPFSSAHFNIYPYKKQWEGASKVTSKHGEGTLRAYPFSLILYLERKMQNEDTKQAEKKMSPEKEVAQNFPSASEPKSKRKRYSPLEDAILKYLLEDLEAESKLSMAGPCLQRPRAERKVKEHPGHVDKKGSKGFDELRQKSGVIPIRGSETPSEVHPGSIQHMGEEVEEVEEEEEEEEEEDADLVPEEPVKPGILVRLASHIFPFSWLFKDS